MTSRRRNRSENDKEIYEKMRQENERKRYKNPITEGKAYMARKVANEAKNYIRNKKHTEHQREKKATEHVKPTINRSDVMKEIKTTVKKKRQEKKVKSVLGAVKRIRQRVASRKGAGATFRKIASDESVAHKVKRKVKEVVHKVRKSFKRKN